MVAALPYSKGLQQVSCGHQGRQINLLTQGAARDLTALIDRALLLGRMGLIVGTSLATAAKLPDLRPTQSTCVLVRHSLHKKASQTS
ncbi:MAG: hypothetical protein HC777_02210 [Hyphomonadaceae bacterium]|nr:hypothetical protein [Hyphomonadaceae bacterium]